MQSYEDVALRDKTRTFNCRVEIQFSRVKTRNGIIREYIHNMFTCS